ncbi:unnamed protein product [Protopolystoma xenopodis]|uniref:Cohesin loading complex subunit SCC4 homolog n=1 Tax=Protopolystoma xenopodis TaxID=117903 RepID=A0A448X139_9PLAT|nr:unnamed protein product [Protopolystoma xenopodis]
MNQLTNDCYASLLGFAKMFRSMTPPNIRLAVHCLKSVLYFRLPPNYEARTHLQLGRLLFLHSKSDDQIKFHLEKARSLGTHLKHPDDIIKFEAADLLADFFERKGKRYEANCVLNDAMRILVCVSKQSHVAERDVNSACETLGMGFEFASIHNSDYTQGLFLLSKCMLLLASRQLPEVTANLSDANRLIENLNGTRYQREALRIFYLVINVSLYLLAGQAKQAHPILRQLHSSIQQFAAMDESKFLVFPLTFSFFFINPYISVFFTASDGAMTNPIDRFQWMPREHMVILVYLITVMQSMQTGLLDRAQRSAEKALTQIEKLSVFDANPLLTVFHLSLLEHTAMGRLVMGVKTAAVQDIGIACRICAANPSLMARRLPQLHTLVGLYAMSMNCMNEAETQFKLALKVSYVVACFYIFYKKS